MTLTDAIRDIYAQVAVPAWAAANLDALVDVLRDLSWLPAGPVEIRVPEVEGPDADRLSGALSIVVAETAGGARPIRVSA